jgi:hypothetical protein
VLSLPEKRMSLFALQLMRRLRALRSNAHEVTEQWRSEMRMPTASSSLMHPTTTVVVLQRTRAISLCNHLAGMLPRESLQQKL